MSDPLSINFPRGARFNGARQLVQRVNELTDALGSRWTVEFKLPATPRQPPRTLKPRKGAPPKQPTVAEVIGYFTLGTNTGPARDMFTVNDYARRWLATRIVDRFLAQATSGGTIPNAGALMTTIAFGLRELVIQRWEAGGGDLNLTPLTAQHVAHKVALGYPTRTGTMTGQSLQALRRAQPIARRTG